MWTLLTPNSRAVMNAATLELVVAVNGGICSKAKFLLDWKKMSEWFIGED